MDESRGGGTRGLEGELVGKNLGQVGGRGRRDKCNHGQQCAPRSWIELDRTGVMEIGL